MKTSVMPHISPPRSPAFWHSRLLAIDFFCGYSIITAEQASWLFAAALTAKQAVKQALSKKEGQEYVQPC